MAVPRWAEAWRDGDPPTEPDGSSAPFDMQLILAYDWGAELEEAMGLRSLALEWRRAAAELRNTTRSLYWDSSRGLYADTPRKKNYSQQTNVLAILAGLVQGKDASALVRKILTDKSLVQCTYYFQHYLHAAPNLTGEGDRYLELLGEWNAMLDRGLTTWAETPESEANYSRSDCHAWSSHPNFEFFRTVLGIRTAGPGFSRVDVVPYLGDLKMAYGTIPHPKGEVIVGLVVQGSILEAKVTLPKGVEGEFVWRGRRHKLTPGLSSLKL